MGQILKVALNTAKMTESTLEKVAYMRVEMANASANHSYNQAEIDALFPLSCDLHRINLENQLNADNMLADRLVSRNQVM
jgi:hypothetical protein